MNYVNTNISPDALFSDADVNAVEHSEDNIKRQILMGIAIGISVMLIGELIKRKFLK